MISLISDASSLFQDVYVRIDVPNLPNACPAYACQVLGNDVSVLRIPMTYFDRNKYYYVSFQDCNEIPNRTISTFNAPATTADYGEFVAEKIKNAYQDVSAIYDARNNELVVYTQGCRHTLSICETDCIVAEIRHFRNFVSMGYDRSCVTCQYADFPVRHYRVKTMDAEGSVSTCPECPDISTSYTVVNGKAKNDSALTPAVIEFTGTFAVYAVGSQPNLEVEAYIDEDTVIPVTQEVGPTGARTPKYKFFHFEPGDYFFRVRIKSHPFCVYDIPVSVEEAPCSHSEISMELYSPNVLMLVDESECGFGSLRINNLVFPAENIEPVENMDNHYYLNGLPQSNFYNLFYSNDCGCFKADTFSFSPSQFCMGTDLRNRIVNFFRVLNESLKTNFTALEAISLPPNQTDAVSILKQFIRSNCVGDCMQLAQSVVTSPFSFDKYFLYAFECGQTVTYSRRTQTNEFKPTSTVRRIVEDVLTVTVSDFGNFSRYYFKFVGLVVTYQYNAKVTFNSSAAAYKEVPLNLSTDPIVYTVDESIQTGYPIQFSFQPHYSELSIF